MLLADILLTKFKCLFKQAILFLEEVDLQSSFPRLVYMLRRIVLLRIHRVINLIVSS